MSKTVEELLETARERDALASESGQTPIKVLVSQARKSFTSGMERSAPGSTRESYLFACTQSAFNNAISELVTELTLEREYSEALTRRLGREPLPESGSALALAMEIGRPERALKAEAHERLCQALAASRNDEEQSAAYAAFEKELHPKD